MGLVNKIKKTEVEPVKNYLWCPVRQQRIHVLICEAHECKHRWSDDPCEDYQNCEQD